MLSAALGPLLLRLSRRVAQGIDRLEGLRARTAPTPYAFALTTGRSPSACYLFYCSGVVDEVFTSLPPASPFVYTLTGAQYDTPPEARMQRRFSAGRALGLVREFRQRVQDRADPHAPSLSVEEALELAPGEQTDDPAAMAATSSALPVASSRFRRNREERSQSTEVVTRR